MLDTNVISEFSRPRPEPTVIRFLRDLEFADGYLSVVTISELRFGIAKLPPGARREQLEHWLEGEVMLDFRDRLLNVHVAIAHACGDLRAKARGLGRSMSISDALIAATAEVHGLTLVTRNIGDFAVWGGPVLNPWNATASM